MSAITSDPWLVDGWWRVLEGAALGLAVFLVALAVKALDDLVDESDETSWSTGGPRVVAYALLFLVTAAGLATGAAVSLFLCAYALGMAPTPYERLPSGLPSWLESVGVVVLSVVLSGPLETAGSLVLLAAVQALDDYRDVDQDRAEGRSNIALVVGRPVAGILAGALFAAAAALSPAKGLAGLIVARALTGGPEPVLGPLLGRPGENREGLMKPGARHLLTLTGVLAVVVGGLSVFIPSSASILSAGGRENWGGVVTAVLPVTPTGWGVWGLALVAFLLTAGVGTGFFAAYRRGLEMGGRCEGEREGALAALLRRADKFDAE